MPLPKRTYHRLATAAEVLGCSVDDLLHWAIVGKTRLGMLFCADWADPPFFLPKERGPTSAEDNERLEDFDGFAYIGANCLSEAERTGKFQFNCIELLDGRSAIFAPMQYDNGFLQATVADLFIHEREFAALRNELCSDQPLLTTTTHLSSLDTDAVSAKGRNTALCIIAALSRLAKLDLAQPYKAAAVISSQLNEMRVELGPEAIAGWLKDIESATTARAK